jgi:hypothetical protein
MGLNINGYDTPCVGNKLPYFPAHKTHLGKSRTPNFQVNSQTKTLDKTHFRKKRSQAQCTTLYQHTCMKCTVYSTDTHRNQPAPSLYSTVKQSQTTGN